MVLAPLRFILPFDTLTHWTPIVYCWWGQDSLKTIWQTETPQDEGPGIGSQADYVDEEEDEEEEFEQKIKIKVKRN